MKHLKIRGNEFLLLIVDDEDLEKLKIHKWYLAGRNRKSVRCALLNASINNFIMGNPPEGLIWDHKDRNFLNNQRNNFRLANNRQNIVNSSKILGSSGYRGVYFDNRRNSWTARIRTDKQRKTLGSFKTAIAAARAYDSAAIIYNKEFAVLNFPK